jgi:NAD-dependent deacetylase
LAIGTTLQVYPIAGVVPIAERRGATLIIVNADATPFDSVADVVLHAGISETLPRIVG